MKEIPVKAIYQCGFCTHKHWMKGVISRHEKICCYNPATQDACIDCANMEVSDKSFDVTYGTGIEGGEIARTINTKKFYCKALGKELYPFAADKKRLPTRYPETFKDMERMPTVCPLRTDIHTHNQ